MGGRGLRDWRLPAIDSGDDGNRLSAVTFSHRPRQTDSTLDPYYCLRADFDTLKALKATAPRRSAVTRCDVTATRRFVTLRHVAQTRVETERWIMII